MTTDEIYMRRAIEAALVGRERGELPFGAILVDPDGAVVAHEQDRVNELADVTQHAEVRLISSATRVMGPSLNGYTVYTTCEPCAMCFTSMWLACVSGVTYGTTIAQVDSVLADGHKEMPVEASAMNAMSGSRLRLTAGVMNEDCLDLFQGMDFRRAKS